MLMHEVESLFDFATSISFGDKLIINLEEGIDLSSKNENRQKDKLIIHQSCVRAKVWFNAGNSA
jgi:hypothetical protein